MKELSNEQMERVSGGEGGFWIGAACAGSVILAGAFIYGTAGVGAAVGTHVLAWTCGGLIGYGIGGGGWL